MATTTAGKVFVSGEIVTPAKLNALGMPTVSLDANEVTTMKIADGSVTDGKLAAVLDLSGKTVTLPDASVTNGKFAGSVGLNGWLTKSAAYVAVAGDRISADTSGGAWTLTLPASPVDYTEVTLADHAGDWQDKNLTVARNGAKINGLAEDLTCDRGGKQFLLRYEGATIGWRIYT